ncbi:uncharacterized protein LOC135832153 [Planococcus citri]|uniref:uncharacterized protein LOC135832153 n=1 Tax=Planococcus citri TaxID=170843 RepID=UPI0031FA1A45
MDQKFTYAFRGVIAFVAFTNLGIAVKAFVEKKCSLTEISGSESVNLILPRVFGSFAFLQALILIHCALCIYHKPLISLGIFSSFLNLNVYLTETFVFHTISFDFQVILPCVLNGIIIVGFAASLLEFKSKKEVCDDENAEILKFANTLKKTRGMKKFK